MSDPNLGWHDAEQVLIMKQPASYGAPEHYRDRKPEQLRAQWKAAGFTHGWNFKLKKPYDFLLTVRQKNRQQYLLIYPQNEAAKLWLMLNHVP